MEDMYRIMSRINDIKKRFATMRHNTKNVDSNSRVTGDYKSMEKDIQKDIFIDKSEKTGKTIETRSIDGINKLADFYSLKNNIPSSLVKAIIETESGYNPDAVSEKGAKGLMQLMPSVMKEMGVNDPFVPAENIKGGVQYLKDLLNRYNWDYKKALSAYNAGAGAVDKSGGVPEYKETKEYVNRVIQAYLKNR